MADSRFKKGKASCANKHTEGTPEYNSCMQTLSRRLQPKGRKTGDSPEKKKRRSNWFESQLTGNKGMDK